MYNRILFFIIVICSVGVNISAQDNSPVVEPDPTVQLKEILDSNDQKSLESFLGQEFSEESRDKIDKFVLDEIDSRVFDDEYESALKLAETLGISNPDNQDARQSYTDITQFIAEKKRNEEAIAAEAIANKQSLAAIEPEKGDEKNSFFKESPKYRESMETFSSDSNIFFTFETLPVVYYNIPGVSNLFNEVSLSNILLGATLSGAFYVDHPLINGKVDADFGYFGGVKGGLESAFVFKIIGGLIPAFSPIPLSLRLGIGFVFYKQTNSTGDSVSLLLEQKTGVLVGIGLQRQKVGPLLIDLYFDYDFLSFVDSNISSAFDAGIAITYPFMELTDNLNLAIKAGIDSNSIIFDIDEKPVEVSLKPFIGVELTYRSKQK